MEIDVELEIQLAEQIWNEEEIITRRQYTCRKCKKSFTYKEIKPGDIPSRCPYCGYEFTTTSPLSEKTKRPFKTNVWEGVLVSDKASREWDF